MTSARRSDASPVPNWLTIPSGRFQMGSFDFYPDEAPQHERTVRRFQITDTAITNAQFAAFVDATGYVTAAEHILDAEEFAHLSDEERAPGSLAFAPTSGPVDLRDTTQWWRWTPGAQWRHPVGPLSDLNGRDSHPVVHVAYADALAYAEWIGARLPTEAEHEYATAGGGRPSPYVWGRERDPGGVIMANTWHGRFPYLNTGANGWVGTSPVGSFPPNGYGLYDCIGNVWEWTSDLYTGAHHAADEQGPGESTVRRVLKGGSYLCAPEHNLRYRPAARCPQPEDTSTNDIGFRCVRS